MKYILIALLSLTAFTSAAQTKPKPSAIADTMTMSSEKIRDVLQFMVNKIEADKPTDLSLILRAVVLAIDNKKEEVLSIHSLRAMQEIYKQIKK